VTTFFPTWRIDGPPPTPPEHSLIQAAASAADGVRIVNDVVANPTDLAPGADSLVPPQAGTERWMSGVAVWPYPPDVSQAWDNCAGTSEVDKGFGTPLTPPEFAAMTIYIPETCTSQQIPDQAEYKARAVRVMNAVESYGVEREFMTGTELPGQPHLADGNGVFPNGDNATKPNYGLQLLEEQIALSGRQGVIHCSPMLATALLGSGFALSDKTGAIRTINGIIVIPGFGYAAGSTPLGHADAGVTEEWAYATGPIDIRRSEVFVTPDLLSQALDRGIPNHSATNGRPNTITYRAERYYVVAWDTAVQAAVLIDRCGSDCNPGS
jgi:hypothetical protein